MSSSGLREQHNRQLNICWKEQYICLHLDWENNTIYNWISVGGNSTYVFVWIQMKTYVLFPPTDIQLSIVLFSQSRWRHMYCSLQQIFNCLLCSGLREQHNRQLNICWREQYLCLHLDWGNNTIDNWISVWKEQSRWRHMHCSLQQIPGIQLSIVLFPQSRWTDDLRVWTSS
jgi:hypothetical protein